MPDKRLLKLAVADAYIMHFKRLYEVAMVESSSSETGAIENFKKGFAKLNTLHDRLVKKLELGDDE